MIAGADSKHKPLVPIHLDEQMTAAQLIQRLEACALTRTKKRGS
jgi:hypothetical protein